MVRAELFRDRPEEFRRHRQIKRTDAILARLEQVRQRIPASLGLGIDRQIVQPLQECVDRAVEVVLVDVIDERLARRCPVVVVAHRPPRYAYEPRRRRKLAIAVAMVKGRQQFAIGEVAGAAEDDKVERIDGDDAAGHGRRNSGRIVAGGRRGGRASRSWRWRSTLMRRGLAKESRFRRDHGVAALKAKYRAPRPAENGRYRWRTRSVWYRRATGPGRAPCGMRPSALSTGSISTAS